MREVFYVRYPGRVRALARGERGKACPWIIEADPQKKFL